MLFTLSKLFYVHSDNRVDFLADVSFQSAVSLILSSLATKKKDTLKFYNSI